MFLSPQKRAVRDDNDTGAMILELKSHNFRCFVTICNVFKDFTINVAFVHVKATSKEICKVRYIFCFLKTMLSQHICSRLKLNYL